MYEAGTEQQVDLYRSHDMTFYYGTPMAAARYRDEFGEDSLVQTDYTDGEKAGNYWDSLDLPRAA